MSVMPSVRIHVDGGLAVGGLVVQSPGVAAFLQLRDRRDRRLRIAPPSVSPSFRPRMILRERLSAKAIAYLSTSSNEKRFRTMLL